MEKLSTHARLRPVLATTTMEMTKPAVNKHETLFFSFLFLSRAYPNPEKIAPEPEQGMEGNESKPAKKKSIETGKSSRWWWDEKVKVEKQHTFNCCLLLCSIGPPLLMIFPQFSPHFPHAHDCTAVGGTKSEFSSSPTRWKPGKSFGHAHMQSPCTPTTKNTQPTCDREKPENFSSWLSIGMERQREVLSMSGACCLGSEKRKMKTFMPKCWKPTDKSHSVDRPENLENEEKPEFFLLLFSENSSRIVHISALRGFPHHIFRIWVELLCNLTTKLKRLKWKRRMRFRYSALEIELICGLKKSFSPKMCEFTEKHLWIIQASLH